MKKLLLFLLVAASINVAHSQQSSVHYKIINGLSIAYRQKGSGPALVLLHGLAQDSRIWKNQLDSLSKQFTVIAWDAPGAGLSKDPPAEFTLNDWADCLAQLLDSTGIRQAHVLGLSWGGLLAQEFYRRHPDRVLSLLLADATMGWKSISDSIANARLQACMKDASLPPKDFAVKYQPGMFSDSPPANAKAEHAAILSDFHPAGFRLMAASLAKTNMRSFLPAIRVPVLLIWGEADKRTPLKDAYLFQQAIHGSKLEIIPGAGHVSNMEKPEEFNKIVRDFCSAK